MTEPSDMARDLWDRIAAECVAPNAQTSDDEAVQQIDAALAVAWDQGHRASERDFEFIWDIVTPDEDRQPFTNPYREQQS